MSDARETIPLRAPRLPTEMRDHAASKQVLDSDTAREFMMNNKRLQITLADGQTVVGVIASINSINENDVGEILSINDKGKRREINLSDVAAFKEID